jgi:hypothetical protein
MRHTLPSTQSKITDSDTVSYEWRAKKMSRMARIFLIYACDGFENHAVAEYNFAGGSYGVPPATLNTLKKPLDACASRRPFFVLD